VHSMGAAREGNVRFIDSKRTHANSLPDCMLAPTARSAAARRSAAAGRRRFYFIGAAAEDKRTRHKNFCRRRSISALNAVSLITI
jgi:hypothetical protein